MQALMQHFELILTSAVIVCLIFYIIDSKSYLKERRHLLKVFSRHEETDDDRNRYAMRLAQADINGIKRKHRSTYMSAQTNLNNRRQLSRAELQWAARPVYPKEKAIEFFSGMFWILCIIWAIRSFLWEPFQIPSASMEPTLQNGDFILTDKYSYGIRLPVLHTKIIPTGEPKRGDVVVFRYPEDPKLNYIKRIIGLPGDKISVTDGVVTLNGAVQKLVPTGTVRAGHDRPMHRYQVFTEQLEGHPHLMELDSNANYRLTSNNSLKPFFAPQGETITVPAGHYFAMGDNRDDSEDSRVWGLVPEENLVGKAAFIWMNSDCLFLKGNCGRIGQRVQ